MIEGEDLALLERSLRHAVENHSGAQLDIILEELGWRDALSVDPRAAVSLLFQGQGAANVTSAALDRVLGRALGRDGPAVVLPAIGEWSSPGTQFEQGRIVVRGLGTASLGRSQTALLGARAGEGDSHVGVEVPVASLPQRSIEGVDPSLGLVEVRGELTGASEVGPVDWRVAIGLGQLALGHELVGASRHMLALARRHALDRIQFGRPIARFQAVRHRLAETLVAIEAADAALAAAWLEATPRTAALAKATAGRAARVTARHCQQVLASIGFTTEHPLHRYVRRVMVLEQLLGGTRSLTRELGNEILERRELPALLPL
jgi:hypothetical protein